jgi:prepilin-type N-terminal cleavage/methylation domain-containing protein/prepilin-type processing-associated H-X9-DG protein
MRKKFTLIELLVVIAIIGILASILMPSLSEARGRSRIAVCVSNSRQAAIATFAVADDFDQRVGPSGNCQAYTQDASQASQTIDGQKLGYIGNIAVSTVAPSNNMASYTAFVQERKNMKAYLCPDDTNEAPTVDVNFGGADDPPYAVNSYAPNFNVFTTYEVSQKYLAGRYALIGTPNQTMMFMDSGNIDAWNTRYVWSGKDKTLLDVYNQYSGGSWEKVFPKERHVKGIMPVVYFDGHVEPVYLRNITPLANVYTSKDF